jgi:hypothetical protein
LRMRILVLDTNVRYANPTPQSFLSALTRRADVVIGGLGYGIDTSDLRALERCYGRFDAIIGQTWMFGEPGVGQYGALIPRDLSDHPAPKVLNLLQIDPHAFPEYQYRACVVPVDLVLSTVLSPQFRIPEAALVAPEEWFDPGAFMVRNQNLVDERWLLVPHCVGDDEFVPLGSIQKKTDASVLGTKYRFRAKAIEHLRLRRDLSCVTLDGVVQRLLYYATTRYFVQRRLDATHWFHRRFRRAIARSRLSITCDASIGYAVRKFFEIPAFGSVLAARFFPEMTALGFRDGTNCFALQEDCLERIEEIVSLLKSDSREAGRLAKAGQEMVWNCHRATVRAEQFLSALNAVINGTYGGTRWRDGRQTLLTHPHPKASVH